MLQEKQYKWDQEDQKKIQQKKYYYNRNKIIRRRAMRCWAEINLENLRKNVIELEKITA